MLLRTYGTHSEQEPSPGQKRMQLSPRPRSTFVEESNNPS